MTGSSVVSPEMDEEGDALLAALEARAASLQARMEQAARDFGEDETEDGDSENRYIKAFDPRQLRQQRTAAATTTVAASAAEPSSGMPLPASALNLGGLSSSAGSWSAPRRRNLDMVRASDAERDYQARCGGQTSDEQESREATAAELRSAATAMLEEGWTPLPASSSSSLPDGSAVAATAAAATASAAATTAEGTPPPPPPSAAADGGAPARTQTADGSSYVVGSDSSNTASARADGEPDPFAPVTGLPYRGPAPKSDLRRAKQVEPEVLSALERECGVNLGKSDFFRLLLEEPQSNLSQQTKILLAAAGNDLLCSAAEDPFTSTTNSAAEVEAQPTACADMSGTVEARLKYFRATPALAPIAKKMGKLPALHLTLLLDGEVELIMEFVGIHQRRYCTFGHSHSSSGTATAAHDHGPCDAIDSHLTESLLKVALDFVFHPSRTKYSKEKLLVREMSTSSQAREEGLRCLPNMLARICSLNTKIKSATILDGPATDEPPATCKKRSFLVFDEDMLKVSPNKSNTKAPAATKSSFQGLGKGFLSSEKKAPSRQVKASKSAPTSAVATTASPQEPDSATSARRHAALHAEPLVAASASAAAPAAKSVSESPTPNQLPDSHDAQLSTCCDPATDAAAPAEKRGAGPKPESQAQPDSTISMGMEDRHKFLLGGAEIQAPDEVQQFREIVAAQRAGGAVAPNWDEEDPEEEVAQLTVSELATQLFGDVSMEDLDIDVTGDGDQDASLTESTKTPSPRAGSTRGGAASDKGCELGGGSASAQGGTASNTAPPPPTAESHKDECEELLNLWMKQRW